MHSAGVTGLVWFMDMGMAFMTAFTRADGTEWDTLEFEPTTLRIAAFITLKTAGTFYRHSIVEMTVTSIAPNDPWIEATLVFPYHDT
jgi:hypothetical protein